MWLTTFQRLSDTEGVWLYRFLAYSSRRAEEDSTCLCVNNVLLQNLKLLRIRRLLRRPNPNTSFMRKHVDDRFRVFVRFSCCPSHLEELWPSTDPKERGGFSWNSSEKIRYVSIRVFLIFQEHCECHWWVPFMDRRHGDVLSPWSCSGWTIQEPKVVTCALVSWLKCHERHPRSPCDLNKNTAEFRNDPSGLHDVAWLNRKSLVHSTNHRGFGGHADAFSSFHDWIMFFLHHWLEQQPYNSNYTIFISIYILSSFRSLTTFRFIVTLERRR